MNKSILLKGSAFALGLMLMTACEKADSPVIQEDPMVEIEIDATDAVKMDAASWGGSGTYAVNITTEDGRTNPMAEHYYGAFPCDEFPLKQVVNDLQDGKYVVVLNATTNLAWISSDVEAGAEDVAYVYAKSGDNLVTVPVPAGRETGFSVPGEFTLVIDVTGGTLELGLGLKQTSMTNWHTLQIKSLSLLGEAALSEIYPSVLEEAGKLAEEKMSAEAQAALAAAIAGPQTVENLEAIKEAVKAVYADAVYKSYQIIKGGVIADNNLDNWTCTTGNTFHINTWSVEGNTDGSGMVTPFIEDWRNAGEGTLGDGEIAYTLTNLLPGDEFTVSALIRVYSEAGNEISGADFFVGDQKVALNKDGKACEAGAAKGIFGTYTATGKVAADGTLKFGVAVKDATFNWIAIKSITIK